LALLFLYRANLQKGGIWQMMLQKMMILGSIAKMKLRDLFTDEKGEVNIVAIVILIGIAVILALIFKDQIKALLETLFGTITKKATDAVNSN
jgi:hydrogenase/urease accessory protein HupE